MFFLQALISIAQQINPKVEFQANKDSLLTVPQPISIQQYLNESPEADIRNIITFLKQNWTNRVINRYYSNIKS